jgi:hypothetical protein
VTILVVEDDRDLRGYLVEMRPLRTSKFCTGSRAENEQSSGWFERLKHRTAVQLEAAKSSPGTSKFESTLPG